MHSEGWHAHRGTTKPQGGGGLERSELRMILQHALRSLNSTCRRKVGTRLRIYFSELPQRHWKGSNSDRLPNLSAHEGLAKLKRVSQCTVFMVAVMTPGLCKLRLDRRDETVTGELQDTSVIGAASYCR